MKSIFLLLLLILLYPSDPLAHSGRTDSYGGHNKTSNGTYHCHSGKCLEDSWEEAYNFCYPKGKEEALQDIKDGREQLSRYLFETFDSDVGEYLIPSCLKAYQEGYEEAYIPTYWEKHWKLASGGGFVLIVAFYKKLRKKSD